MLVLLNVVALAAVVAAAAALVTAHLIPTGLSAVSDPVSAYGISKARGLYRAQTLATAVAAAVLALSLLAREADAAAPSVASLLVLAATRAVISWVPMDADDAARTGRGRIHNLLAFGAFAAASVGGFMVGITFAANPDLADLAGVATALGWFTTIASALTLVSAMSRPLRRIFGLVERLIYVGMLAWLAFTAIALILR